MSNGTLQQLASKGVQDTHLSISPETSFWKRTYKRVSNYATESIDITIPSFNFGQESVTQISRNGDLISDVWLVVTLKLLRLASPSTDTVRWTNVLGHALIESAALEVGNNEIDKTTGLLMEIMHELESDVNRDVDELVLRAQNATQLINWSHDGNTFYDSGGAMCTRLYIKLPFYLSAAPSQAMPVISLQYHDIRCKIKTRTKEALYVCSNNSNTTLSTTYDGAVQNASFMVDFVYLDSTERRLFAANAHEYLITNWQISEFNTKDSAAVTGNYSVTFNHPVTAMYWVVQKSTNSAAPADQSTGRDYFNFERTANRGDDTFCTATIKFNGSEREKARDPLYFRVIKSAKHFNRTPRKNVYNYPFSMYPSSWFPSGSCNLSRIDTTTVSFTFPQYEIDGSTSFAAADCKVFAKNFNVVRIQGG